MVCVPCFIIPVLLFIWRLIVVPLFRKFWGTPQKKEPEFPFECKGGVCPIKPRDKSGAQGEGEQGDANPHAINKDSIPNEAEIATAEDKKLI